jgi:hypothetical protein
MDEYFWSFLAMPSGCGCHIQDNERNIQAKSLRICFINRTDLVSVWSKNCLRFNSNGNDYCCHILYNKQSETSSHSLNN